MGLTRAEFDALEWQELHALLDAIREADRHELRRDAALLCMLANCHRDPKKSALTIEDFLPKEQRTERDEEAEIDARIRGLRAMIKQT